MTDTGDALAMPPPERLELNRRIGLAALKRAYIDVEGLAQSMLLVGQNPEAPPSRIWVASGLLDRTELAELLSQFNRAEGPADRGDDVLPSTAMHTAEVIESHVSINLANVVQFEGPQRELDEDEDRPNSRYLLGKELGRGGVGRVLRVFDRALGRNVAMKVPLVWPGAKADRDKFVEEAQATGQLEHPNIVPIYDIGALETGEIYYTMKRVRAYSLRDVFDGLLQKDPKIVAEYTMTRLLSIYLQVCQAVSYAHDRGVVHRDLKPDNVMLGEYGEVHVMDWGLAHIVGRAVVTDRSLRGDAEAESGQTVGTPAYMPPEQANGAISDITERSDIYSLGVILYEIYTLKQPSARNTVVATLMAVITEPIPPPSSVTDTPISEDMEFIIMTALEKDANKRWKSARELHDAVEKVLDGRTEREMARHILEGERYVRLYETTQREMLRMGEAVHEANTKIDDWLSIEVKRRIWELEDQYRDLAMRMVTYFGNAIREFTLALARAPDDPTARAALAKLYFNRYELAEREENALDKLHFRALLEQYDDGTFQRRLVASAPVSIYTTPKYAAVFLYELTESDRRRVPGSPTFLGQSPVPERFVGAGSYMVRVKHPKHPPVSVPLGLNRSDPFSLNVTIPTAEQYAPGFVFVSTGISIIGGDPEAYDPLPQQRVDVDAFFMQNYPVSFADYAKFLDDVGQDDPDLALARAPRTRGSDGPLVALGPNGKFVPSESLIVGDMRARYPRNEGHEARMPIIAIRYEDAQAYCAWRAAKDGVAYRLPTEFEWERAARGADGRFFPWGDRFDANFAKMSSSRSIESHSEPIGAFPFDRSPFDVFDLAGGVQEWVESTSDDKYAIVRGGHWAGDQRACRTASRKRYHRYARLATVGFRMVYSLT